MNDELFATTTTLSPRLQWMKKHDIRVVYDEEARLNKWIASYKGKRYGGASEYDALCDLAIDNNLKLWNEE